jgi:hypothetical protein
MSPSSNGPKVVSPYIAVFEGSVAFASAASECSIEVASALLWEREPTFCQPLPANFEELSALAYDDRGLAVSDGRRVWLAILGHSQMSAYRQ